MGGILACQPCHGPITKYTDIKASADYDGNGKIEGVQTEINGLLAKLKNKLPQDSLTGDVITMMKDSLKVKGNQKMVGDIWNYWFVMKDRSIGVHNPKYAIALLQKALGITFTGDQVPGSCPGELCAEPELSESVQPDDEHRVRAPAARDGQTRGL